MDGIIDSYFKISPYGPYTMDEQFVNDVKIWEYRTRKQARNFLRIYLENPVSRHNFVLDLKKILYSGNDGFITLRASEGTTSGLTSLYSGNEVFQDGLTIPITYDELVKLASLDNNGIFSDSILYTLQSPSTPLSFNLFWALEGEEIGNKLINAFNKLKDMFKDTNLGEFKDREFDIRFYNDGGNGIGKRLITRFADFGITKSTNILFYPNDPTQLNNAIASMLVYLLILPDSFVDVKLSGGSPQRFMFADLFNLHTPDYVQAHSYSNIQSTIQGTFMWDRNTGRLTRDNYNTYMNEFSRIFDHVAQHYFLGFDSLGDILETIEGLFRNKIDASIQLKDFRG